MTVDDCPLMFPDARERGLACQSHFCRFMAPKPTGLPDATIDIEVLRPEEGETFAEASELTIEVAGPAGVYVFVVTKAKPKRLQDLGSAVWVATVTNPNRVNWRDGSVPPSTELPLDVPLYLTVLRYDPARLAGMSPAVPFVVGGDFKSPGDSCIQSGEIGGDCANPLRLQICGPDDVCAVMCASNRDCSSKLTAGVCDTPDSSGTRRCVAK